jgi:hypothetical protein
MSVRAPAGRRLAAEGAAVRRDGTAGRRAGGSRRDSGGRRNLAVHSAIVGLAGVFVLGALLLAALAGVLTGTAQPAPPAAVTPAAVTPAAITAALPRTRVISAVSGGPGWRARTVTRLSPLLMSAAADPPAGAAYELVASRAGGTGPFRLWRIGLPAGPAGAAGPARRGPTFPVADLSVAGGFVWVSGDLGAGPPASRLVLFQVSPRTLAIVAAWRWPGPAGRYTPVSVAGGPGRTVWVGAAGTLRQLSTRTGVTVRQVRLPAGLLASDIAADPGARYLYVAGEGQLGAVTALEYAAGSGRLLVSAARTPLRFSVGGAALTAVPGGVWASFRTGMLGQTVLLRQPDLGSVPLPAAARPGVPPAAEPGVPPAAARPDLYGYAMGASTSYGGGALWLSQGTGGLTGCAAPATGQVRSVATLRSLADGGELLGVRPAAREVIAAGPSGLIVITAPARCWA